MAKHKEQDPCPTCGTSSTARAEWEIAEEAYRVAMDPTLSVGKPSIQVRDAKRDTTLALERRRACPEKHEDC